MSAPSDSRRRWSIPGLVSAVRHAVAAREARVPLTQLRQHIEPSVRGKEIFGLLSSPGCTVIAGCDPCADKQRMRTYVADLQDSRVTLVAGTCCPLMDTHCINQRNCGWSGNAPAEALPPFILRDVVIEPYQVLEARAFGADAICLRASLLEQERLLGLYERAISLGMEVIIEVGNPADVTRALAVGAKILGVSTLSALSAMALSLPEDVVRIALEPVASPAEVMAYAAAGADAVIGYPGCYSLTPQVSSLASLCSAGLHPACPSR